MIAKISNITYKCACGRIGTHYFDPEIEVEEGEYVYVGCLMCRITMGQIYNHLGVFEMYSYGDQNPYTGETIGKQK